MTKPNDGGPAFPTDAPMVGEHLGQNRAGEPVYELDRSKKPGMTLRDYFAAKAMKSFLDEAVQRAGGDPESRDLMKQLMEAIPSAAYTVADLMLSEREKVKP